MRRGADAGDVPQPLRRRLPRRRAPGRRSRRRRARPTPGWTPRPTSATRPSSSRALAAASPTSPARGRWRILGDSVTTDHISPAGSIKKDSPAGRYLIEHGVEPADFNSYGSRRGNHEVMMRGTFANIRIRNEMAPGTEGGVTRHMPDGEVMSIYDAAMQYQADGVPLVIIAGKEYGTGSSRDWAAKGTRLLGVQGGDRRELRAHPPLQPGRHGHPAAAVQGRRQPQDAGARRQRDLRHHRPRRRDQAADGGDAHHPPRRRRSGAGRRCSAGSIRSTRSNTTATAASCSTCCVVCQRRPDWREAAGSSIEQEPAASPGCDWSRSAIGLRLVMLRSFREAVFAITLLCDCCRPPLPMSG